MVRKLQDLENKWLLPYNRPAPSCYQAVYCDAMGYVAGDGKRVINGLWIGRVLGPKVIILVIDENGADMEGKLHGIGESVQTFNGQMVGNLIPRRCDCRRGTYGKGK